MCSAISSIHTADRPSKLERASRALSALLLGVLLMLLPGEADAQTQVSFPANANGQITFIMPSKNIGCTFTPQGGTPNYQPSGGGPELSCDRIEPQYVRVVLTPNEVRRIDDVGDQGCCDASNVFPYGTQWSQAPFTCRSAQSGLTCTREDGRGFQMARAGVRLQ